MKSALINLCCVASVVHGQSMLSATVTLASGPADLRLFSEQRPEDAVDDFIMDHMALIGNRSDKVSAAVLSYLCEEAEKVRATGATHFLACDGQPSRAVVGSFDVSDLALPITTVRLRAGYSLPLYAAMLCAVAGPCGPEELVQLRLRLNSDYIQLVSAGPADELARHFAQAAAQPGDINEHIHTLEFYALQCSSILELGVSNPVSTYAFLYGLAHNGQSQKRLRSVDVLSQPSMDPALRIARENGVHLTYEIINGLELQGLEPVDMTFIDTWHIYGHLKRELEKFAPHTKKWIAMHDTEVDGLLGESVRDRYHNVTREHLETGYPVVDIVKGLLPAIEEFVAAHPDWVVETTRKGNNGMIILKRVSGEPWTAPIPPFVLDRPLTAVSKVDVFLVTYIVDTPVSLFTPPQRYEQTVHTVASIRQRYPAAIIVVLDASLSQGVAVPGADLTVRHPGPSALTDNRGVGETYIMQSFLESHLFSVLAPFARMVHKISGRYALDDRHDSLRLGEGCVNAAIPRNHHVPLPPTVHETIYYTFPASFAAPLVKELARVRQVLLESPETSVEDELFANFYSLGLMCSHQFVGVSGVQAPTGLKMVI